MDISTQPTSPVLTNRSYLRHARLVLTCISIGANAIFAGGVFTFALMSPALVTHLKLTQPQLTTIALAGMMGQYPFAAVVGKIVDRFGPWACSLISACLFSTGYGMFSWEIAKTPDDITQPSASSFHRLTGFFFMAGLATVFSYFSSVFAASKNFPNYIGIASGTSMALFGLSPMFLSIIASRFFSYEDSGLDVTSFLRFLAITCGCVHVFGAMTLRIPDLADNTRLQLTVEDTEEQADVDERTALLQAPHKSIPGVEVQVVPVEVNGSALDLLKDRNFWLLAFVVFVILGSSEMIISNIGTIVLSLPSAKGTPVITRVPSADIMTSTQVRLLSVANTVSRLLVGPLADFISPVASYLPSGAISFPRKHIVSRMSFLTGATLVLAFTYLWMTLVTRSQEALWLLSIGTGIAYGAAFTVLPSIVSSVWGLSNLGRNYGILTYAPFLGTPSFSYLYAFVAEHNTEGGGVCEGVRCWQPTFWLSSGAAIAACCGTLALWRTWKGRV